MHTHSIHIYTCAHTCTTGKTTHMFIHSLTHANSHMHAHERTHKHTHTLSCLWKTSFVKSIWMWNGEGPERSWGIRVGFWGTLIPTSDGSFWRWGVYFCNIWPVSPLLREDGEIWQVGNLERTNWCHPLSPSVISSLGATRGHELRSYLRAGPGGRLPWSRPLWESSVLGSLFAHRYKLHHQYPLQKGEVASSFIALFLHWLRSGRKEESYLLGYLTEWFTTSLLWPWVFKFPQGKEAEKTPLLLSTRVSTSCLWCIRHPRKYLLCVFIYDTSMTWSILDAFQLSQSLEAHWTKDSSMFSSIYLYLVLLARALPFCWPASLGSWSQATDVPFPPLRCHHCWLCFIRHLIHCNKTHLNIQESSPIFYHLCNYGVTQSLVQSYPYIQCWFHFCLLWRETNSEKSLRWGLELSFYSGPVKKG